MGLLAPTLHHRKYRSGLGLGAEVTNQLSSLPVISCRCFLPHHFHSSLPTAQRNPEQLIASSKIELGPYEFALSNQKDALQSLQTLP